MQHFKEYINHFIYMSDETWQMFVDLLTPVYFQKGQPVYGASETPDELYFIVEGIVRSYKLEESGKDFTWAFHCLNNDALEHRELIDVCVVDYANFLRNRPSELSFEALSDATLMKITKRDVYTLCQENEKWQAFFEKMTEEAYCAMQDRTMTLLTKSAGERLEMLQSYYPGVFEKDVPLAHIASYLGITRQSLARLRS